MQGSSASVSQSTASRQRGARRQRNRGKIRAGSPGEELALVEHLKGMALTSSAHREVNSLVLALIMLGKTEAARQLQRAADNFIQSQAAAMKLCEETISTEIVDEAAHTLDRYREKTHGGPSLHSSILSP